jgi:tetratricopeptide (TPR) repeat protein
MRYLLIVILFLVLGFRELYAQNQAKIDSLMSQLTIAKDNAQVDVLNELAWEYHFFQSAKAREYGEQALELAQKSDYTKGIALSLRYIGMTYRTDLDFTRAQKYYYLAIALEEKLGNKEGIAQCLQNIGSIYNLRGDFKEALKKYRRAVEIFEEIGHREGTVKVLSQIADVYYKTAKYENALHFAQRSMDLAQQVGKSEGVVEASLILADAHARKGDYQEAYHYHILHTQLKDSNFTLAKKKEIQRIENRFAQEKREIAERMQKEKDDEINKRNQQFRDNIQYAIIGILFIALFGGILLSGRLNIPQAYVESAIFITLLLLFRFFQTILMPFADSYSESSPLVLLLANVGLALLFMPLHGFLERRLKKRVFEEGNNTQKAENQELTK